MEQLHQIKDTQKIIDFIFSGCAIITVRNEDSKNRFTFKIQKNKGKNNSENVFWVKVLTMPDNQDDRSYKFIGGMTKETGFKHSGKAHIALKSKSVQVAHYYFNRLLGLSDKPLHSNVATYHMGYCGRCGKLLTVPESIDSGFGQECAFILNIPYEVRKSTFRNTLFDIPAIGINDYQIRLKL